MDRRLRPAYEVEAIHELLDELNYYQLLGLSPSAEAAEVEPAFRRESRRLHPDRVARVGSAEVRQQANRVFRAINEAYRTLRDPEAREAYDQELNEGAARLSEAGRQSARAASAASADPSQAARTEKGGKYWRMALQCWAAEDYAGCVLQVQFALTYEPDNEVFKEWQAKAKEKADERKSKENPFKLRIV